ncbi:MAG: ABC transporter permease [Verrucomicrobiales bacterium]|nr:ABC transporter permease [Verrucomicrobiales bacterium]
MNAPSATLHTGSLRPRGRSHRLGIGHWRRVLRLGIKSLWAHRLRSLLTVLGIVFGVCSVIAMLAIGEGASYEAQEQLKSLGSQNIILRSIKPAEDQKVSESGSRQNYTLAYGLKEVDVRRIRSTVPGIEAVVPGRIIRDFAWNVRYRVDCEIVGTVSWYPEMRNHPVMKGRFFTDREYDGKENVCVIGAEMVERLFPFEQALGGSVRVGRSYFKVVGIMAPRPRLPATAGGDNSAGTVHRMFIPLSTARTHYGEILFKRRSGSFESERVELHEVTVKVDQLDRVRSVAAAIDDILKFDRKKKDYDMLVPLELLKRAEETRRLFNIVLGSIAAISLLVGGIGIMNIMLATVTERTREIGVRRALGARRADIITQFVAEATMLSAAGGLLGVMLGVSIPWVVTAAAGMKTIVTWWSLALSFGISAIVGIAFGLYPATRAAQMDPVEALRHE